MKDTLFPTFRWEAVPNAERYAFAISVEPYGPANVIYRNTNLTGTSFTLDSSVLEYGGKYRWNMQAGNSAGLSDVSSLLYFQIMPLPVQPPQPQGSLRMTIEPSGARTAGAQWRLTSGPDTGWKNSGAFIHNLPAGNTYTITFRSVSGWTAPGNQSVTIVANATATKEATYQQDTPVQQEGSLRMTIEPFEARTAGAQWRLTSGPDTGWKNSGAFIHNLPAGNTYTITFRSVSGWTAPGNQSVTIVANATATKEATYQQDAPVQQTLATRAVDKALAVKGAPYRLGAQGRHWDHEDGHSTGEARWATPKEITTTGYRWKQSIDDYKGQTGLDCCGLVMWAYSVAHDPNCNYLDFMKEGVEGQWKSERIQKVKSFTGAKAVQDFGTWYKDGGDAVIQPGDLIYFMQPTKSSHGHVVMYIGDGKIVHATPPKVIEESLHTALERWPSRFELVGVGRVRVTIDQDSPLPPQISTARPSLSTVTSGGTITITYNVTNPGAAITVLLGASIQLPGRLALHDPANDRKVTISSGDSSSSRPFAVPTTAPSGTYNLLVSLWKDVNNNGEIDDADLALSSKTFTGALQVNLPSPADGIRHTYGPTAGWYMVSVPTTGNAASLFGGPMSTYDPATRHYVSATTIDPSKGYWVRLPANKAISTNSTQVTSDVTVDIPTAGWWQISAPWSYSKSAMQVTKSGMSKSWADAVSAGWVRDQVYGYKATDVDYTTPTTLDPWYGYWMKALVPGLRLRLTYTSMPVSPTGSPLPTGTGVCIPMDLPPLPPTPQAVASQLVFGNYPNPVTDTNTTTFMVRGPMAVFVEQIKVRIFDLVGRLVYERAAAGTSLDWHTNNMYGEYLANGVYLYMMYAKIDGEWAVSEVKKLVILR
jgi:cell wall-associated NlpC family hydrolase